MHSLYTYPVDRAERDMSFRRPLRGPAIDSLDGSDRNTALGMVGHEDRVGRGAVRRAARKITEDQ